MSLLEIGEGVVEVKATSGDNHLGGDDWDSRVVEWMVKKFKDANGVDLGADKIAKQRLQEAAEKAKIELSSSSETTSTCPTSPTASPARSTSRRSSPAPSSRG